MSILQLDRSQIMAVPTAAEMGDEADDDPLACAICCSADASDENPIIKCDGPHSQELGYHLKCMGSDWALDEVPEEAWYCPACRESGLFEVESVLDKRTHAGKVQYRLHWRGYAIEDASWEPLANIPKQSMQMIREFNAAQRAAATFAAGSSSAQQQQGPGKGGGRGKGDAGRSGARGGGRGGRRGGGRGGGRGGARGGARAAARGSGSLVQLWGS